MIKSLLRFLFTFKGRAGGLSYALYQLALVPALLIFNDAREQLEAGTLPSDRAVPLILLGVFIIWSCLAVLSKRMHDFGARIWWWGVPVILSWFFKPFIYICGALVAFVPADRGINRFGPQPRTLRAWRLRRALSALDAAFIAGKIDAAAYNAQRHAILEPASSDRPASSVS